jgi:signal transduction histidine kinase
MSDSSSRSTKAFATLRAMLVENRWPLFRCATPFLAVATASVFTSLLPERLDPSHFTLFFLAVMLSAWYGGFVGGLLATVLSAFSLDYFFISPVRSIELDAHALVRLGVFLIVSLVTNYLTNARRRAEDGLKQAHAQLEDRVRERTAELAESNRALREEINERRRIENELLRLQHEMGRVERLATLGRITGAVAHDLGTPLNSVLGYAQLLAQEDLPERARRRLSIIETQIHRMGDIIQNYLSYTRTEPTRRKTDINELIRDTVVLLQPLFKQRSVVVSTRLAPGLPEVYGDSNSIQRVFINLLDNAVDACGKEGEVRISTLAQPGANRKTAGVVVELADTGAGIPQTVLPKVFDLFVTTKAPGEGTGLGLAICQEIVRAHGGMIKLESQFGAGTTVTVFLPVSAKSVAAPEDEERNDRSHNDR